MMWNSTFLHTVNAGGDWAAGERLLQSFQALAGPLGDDLNGAIREVSGPPPHTEALRQSPYKPAESDSLHPASHQVAGGCHRLSPPPRP